jgi:hypothetical protein
MTTKEYNRQRKLPERIKATNEGKEIVKHFIEETKERLKIEHPDKANDLSSIMLSTIFYFTKYLIGELVDEKTGKNSLVFVYGEMSDGQRLYTHNLLVDNKKDYKLYVKNKEQFSLDLLKMLCKEDKEDKGE